MRLAPGGEGRKRTTHRHFRPRARLQPSWHGPRHLGSRDRRSFGEARERTLREGLALSPAERLRLSEELWSELARGHQVTLPWTAAFDTFDEYERWRRMGAPAG